MTTSPGTFFHGTGDPWRTFGTEDFCTWREPGEPGVAIFQTRRPDFANAEHPSSPAAMHLQGVVGG